MWIVLWHHIELRKKTDELNVVEYRYLQTQFDVKLNVTLTSAFFVLRKMEILPKIPHLGHCVSKP